MSTYKSGFMEGFKRWRGSILVTQRNHILHLLCNLPKHCSNSDRSGQEPVANNISRLVLSGEFNFRKTTVSTGRPIIGGGNRIGVESALKLN
jgi:hypothetical protein